MVDRQCRRKRVRIALTSVSPRVTICELGSKSVVSLQAVMGTLRKVFMHVMYVNTQNNKVCLFVCLFGVYRPTK